MHSPDHLNDIAENEDWVEPVRFEFGLTRRGFVQILSTGLLITASAAPVVAQRAGGRGEGNGRGQASAARILVGKDGLITVMSGKVEMGQGARAELTQAAAEELRVPAAQVQMVLADTSVVPDDGLTAGSRTTPSTVPSVRQAAAMARELLVQLAASQWQVAPDALEVKEGKILAEGHSISYAELARSEDLAKAFQQKTANGARTTATENWKVLGHSLPRPNRNDLVTGKHLFPSDLVRPGMLYGKVLRPPSYGAKLLSIDLELAKATKGVMVVRDGDFVGIAAPNSHLAKLALQTLADSAKWEAAPHPSSREIYQYLRSKAQGTAENPFSAQLASAAKSLKQSYHIAYVQHAPLEPRVALAEWNEGKLTVWTGTQNPFGYRGELARAFHLGQDQVRVVVPDFGSGFGGKHTGEVAIEAARIAQGAGRPVLLRWTREEEFTWAYFRPAAVIDIEAGLDSQGELNSWFHVNINSGASSIETPYRAVQARTRFINSQPPLRQGSYRALAATANTFARECFMDELAAAAGSDPLLFRRSHLDKNSRLLAVLEEAARRFNWPELVRERVPNFGVGLACGTEKGSYVATCAQVEIDRGQNRIHVRKLTTVFECGAILNPDNLLAQVQGGILMGLGPALREQMRFENGKMGNAKFERYLVPRFSDVPELDIHLLDRKDLPSVGAGETPLIAVAPAIANAVFHATGTRVREMPVTVPPGARA